MVIISIIWKSEPSLIFLNICALKFCWETNGLIFTTSHFDCERVDEIMKIKWTSIWNKTLNLKSAGAFVLTRKRKAMAERNPIYDKFINQSWCSDNHTWTSFSAESTDFLCDNFVSLFSLTLHIMVPLNVFLTPSLMSSRVAMMRRGQTRGRI